ncbi:LamG-like jellyroll fold domain-containing protein [Terrimonas pollutisoli]|uniref:LamG-like jellyroll fold domain-containing protein n=1 Tax=Terrimonas pollutisoli TaxID=3034147 RepID=UPI0023ED481D|nr:LamG-like jellyroll fold domain-containing protein [Terrimonas sp. H1YJ31]
MKFFTLGSVMKTAILNCFWVTVFTFLICVNTKAQRFQHPGIPFTKYDLEQLKANITKEPWLSAYNSFKEDYRSKLTYTANPKATVTRAPNLNNTVWINDMIAVHHLAFMWVFTGDSAYARKGTDIIDAWAVTNTVWGGNESMLDIGDFTEYWATGADILRGTFPGWTDSNTVHVKNYFANVLYPTSFVPYQLRDANKGALQLKIALAAAAFCDDVTRFNQAIDVYRMDAGGGMRNSLTNGEVGDAGRDDHWRVQAAAIVWGAELAWKQGIDMYAELDNRVLAIGELYHKFAFEGDTMTFIPFGGYASYWTNWGIAPGARRGDMTNLMLGAYALRKGIPTPYTDKMRAALGGAGGDFLYLKSSDTSTATPLPPVYYPSEHVQPVSHLTNTDIGNPGIAGSASYNNGVWTVKAAGNSTSSAFNYTFKKMSGDAGLVVKVDNMSLSSGGSGVMIRQSVAPGAPFWDIFLSASGGTGRHWQPKAPWWLKIERVGNRIFTYHSHDGANWTALNCFYSESGYPAELYYGFYTLSNNTSALNTTNFTNVGFSQAAPEGSPEISSATSLTTTVGAPFNYTITASGAPTTYGASGLPEGLSIDAVTGVISGTPTAIGQSEITLTATNGIGTGRATLMLKVIGSDIPAVPDSVVATVVNTTQIKLTWKASANATGYSVKRSLTPGGPYTLIQSGINVTSFTDAAPVPEVNNYYVVTALTGELESGVSNEVFGSVPPAIPGKPVVTSKNGQIDLTWATANGATSYKVKRSLTTGGPYTVIAQVSANSYSDVNVINGTGYYYVVSSAGTSLESANSLESFGVPGSNSSTWSSTPGSNLWSETGNWVENSVPQSPAIVTFKNTADSVLTNNLTGLEVSRMLFDTTASAYTVNGNSFTLKTDLVNISSNTQTITTPITINEQVNVTATSTIKYTGVLSGSGGLTKNGGGWLMLSGQNTYSGNTILNGVVAIQAHGKGTSGAPTSGPLGTGKIIMNGGTIQSGDSAATIYNDIEVVAGKRSFLNQTVNSMTIYGRITGSGTLWEDGNDYPGINLYGDNSGFTGTFVAALRSGRNRVRFMVPEAGSAKAYWNLDANGIDCIGIGFKTGTLHFGALSGRGYIRNNAGGTPIISIGALNQSTWFGGTIANYFDIVKVGTGTLFFGGNHTYWGTTTIKDGAFLLSNSPTNGAFASPVVDSSGIFGGTGLSQASVTIGTGTSATAMLEPGNGSIGTFTTTSSLTLNSNAIYNVQVSTKDTIADKIKAGTVNLVGYPALAVVNTDSAALALGTNFTIIENTGSNAVSGTFKDLPELGLIKLGNHNFRITYIGGDGNDVVLRDERVVPMTIVSAKTDTALVGKAYSYTIQAIHSPNSFNAAGLPDGLSVNPSTGVISGTPTVSGNFAIVLTAANDTASVTDTLRLAVLKTVVENVLAAEGDTKVVLEWNPILNLTYNITRSTSQSGPFTLVGKATAARFADSLLTNGTTYYYIISSVDGSVEYPGTSPIAATPQLGQWDYYKFNDSTGTKAIDSWGARHGAFTGGASWTDGLQGKAVKLNGSNGYVTLPTALMSSVNNFTIATWAKVDASANWARIFDFGTGTTNYMFLTARASTGYVRYEIITGGVVQQINSTVAIAPGGWHHFAVTLSGTTGILYVDGVEIGRNNAMTTKPSSLGNTTQNWIGKSQWSSDPLFNGSVDEFRIYNKGLSASEILALVYQSVPPPSPINLSVIGGNNQIALTWSAPTSATGYNVKRAETAAGPFTTIANVTSTSYIDSTAENCKTYFYVVSAINSVGEGANSSVASLSFGKKLTGALIGTNGSWGNNAATTKAAAVDGNLATFFDAPTGTAWVGYDLGANNNNVITKLRYAPRANFAPRMVGGMFQGSNVADFSSATTLFTVTAQPTVGVYTEQTVSNSTAFRYIRYISSSTGFGNVAEVEFYGFLAQAPQMLSKAGTQNIWYDSSFSYSIQASNRPNSYSAAGLPDGLTLNTCNGIISGAPTTAGTFSVILTAANDWGSVNDTMTLTVYRFPTVKTKSIEVAVGADGKAFITPQQVDDGSIGYSGVLILSLDKTDFTCADIGSPVTVTLTATDADGHSGTGTAQVTIVDNINPIITAPTDVNANADNGVCAATNVSLGAPVTSDNCGVQSVTNDAPASFLVGSTVVTWTVTDVHGNKSTAQQTVTVADNEKPTLTAASNQFFCYSIAGSYTVPSLIANDNCGIASVSYSVSGATSRSGNGSDASGSFNAGESTIAWTVTDIHGNVSNASTVVTVNAPLAVSIPDVYALSAGVDANTIYTGYGASSLTITALPAGGSSPYTYSWNTSPVSTTQAISVTAAGTYTVTVTDAKGCEATVSITIKVVDVRCGNKNKNRMICHSGNSLCVPYEDVQDHLNHGDYLGTCNATPSRSANTSTAASVELVKEGTIVYPNPVTDKLIIKVSRLQEGALVKVYNVNGAVVVTTRLTNIIQSLPVQTLAAGIYYVQVINGGVLTTTKIVKQ